MNLMINTSSKSLKAWSISGLLILMAGAVFISAPVEAQSNRDLQSRINRLENEIDTLSRAVYKGEQPPAGSVSGGPVAGAADVEIRLQQIETEMRDLRGEMERVAYENRQLREDMERITGDLELRMNDLDGSGASARPSNNRVYNAPNTNTNRPVINTIDNTPPQPNQAQNGQGGPGNGYQWSTNNTGGQLGSYTVDNAGNASASATGPAALYDRAFSLVKNRQYDAAQNEFEDFLNQYPSHELAGNAKYWLGETHYVRGDFETASRIFAEGYQQFPKGSKAADNLLKLGLSLEAAGKPQDACIALRQLKKENPAGETPVLRRATQEMSRLGC